MRTTTALSYFSAEVLGFLSSFRRRAWRAHAVQYALGLVLLVRFRSVSELARRMGEQAVDALHHFLHDSPWSEGWAVWQQYATIAERVRATGERIRLILDDTPVERAGPHIEGLGIHHSAKGLIRGQCAVTAVVKAGALTLAWAVRGYVPKGACGPGEFQSKVELALAILWPAQALGEGVTVLLDSWYACKKILNRIAGYGWRYVAAIKCNRVVWVGNRKTNVRHLAKGPRQYERVKLSRRRTVWVAKCRVMLPGIGAVALFITKLDGGVKFLVSNDLELAPADAVREYAVRFSIETFHRDLKQHLGFGELWCRSWRAVQRHWILCQAAYNALQFWNASRPPRCRCKTFGQTVRAFRAAVREDDAVRWCRRYAEAA